jgi:hypothetical protein
MDTAGEAGAGAGGAAPAAAPAPAPTATPAPATGSWVDSLPPELRETSAAKKYKDVPALAKAYSELESMQGNSLRFPSKEAGDVDRKAFKDKVLARGKEYGVIAMPDLAVPEQETGLFRVLGTPVEPGGYKIPEIADVEGLKFDAAEVESLRPVFHKANLTQKQFDTLVSGVAAARMGAAKEQLDRNRLEQARMRETWGEAATSKVAQVGKWLELNKGPASLQQAVKAGTVNAESMFWLHGMMTAFGGETNEIASQAGDRVAVTPSEALARVGEVETRMKDMSPGDPAYQELLQDRLRWLERAGTAG